jgi:hypothetical protein
MADVNKKNRRSRNASKEWEQRVEKVRSQIEKEVKKKMMTKSRN